MNIPISKPSLGKEEIEAAGAVIRSGWVTQGPKVSQFEEAFAQQVGSRYACAVSNCTTALHLALLATGVSIGDVVVTVSHSFIATANAVLHCGAHPAFVDIDGATYNMSPESLEAFLRDDCQRCGDELVVRDRSILGADSTAVGRVSAVLVPHQIGMPAPMKELLSIADEYGIPVVEDAACAIGSEVSMDDGATWHPIGQPQGQVACFSLHPRKILTTGEGGMITTNRTDFDRQFRLLRQHGMSMSDVARHAQSKVAIEQYLTAGYNYRMTDIQAAIGLEQLKKLPAIVAAHRSMNELYHEVLGDISWIGLPIEPRYARSNWQSYAVRIKTDAPRSRDAIMQYLLDAGVSTRPGIMNSHEEPPYRPLGYVLPESEDARRSVILLPLHAGLQEHDIRKIADLLRAL